MCATAKPAHRHGFGIEAGAQVPVVDFDFAAVDSATTLLEDDGRDVLRATLGLLLTPCPRDQAAARTALLYAVLNPGLRRHEILHRFPGVRKSHFDQARLELSSLLSAGLDEKKNAPVGAEAILTDVGNHVRDGDSDAP